MDIYLWGLATIQLHYTIPFRKYEKDKAFLLSLYIAVVAIIKKI